MFLLVKTSIATLGGPMGNTTGRRPFSVVITDEDRKYLQGVIRATKSPQSHVTRAKIALLSADGVATQDIATTINVSEFTVSKWRKRFSLFGVAILDDAPRSGSPRKFDDDKIAEILRVTLECEPPLATHWSTTTLAKKVGVSQPTISRIWRTFGLKPHLVQYFNISTDPNFTEKVRDIVGLYLNPPDAALVLCVDEKTQIQALDRTQPVLPLRPFVPERQTHDYKRNGTTNLYAALEMASGKVITNTTKAHRAVEFIAFLNQVKKQVPKDLSVHLILDNVSTHKTDAVRAWLLENPRFHFHFTPTYSSWMNLVERWFSELTTKWLRRSTHKSERDLVRSINHWISLWNENPQPFKWTKSAEEIFASMEKYLKPLTECTSD